MRRSGVADAGGSVCTAVGGPVGFGVGAALEAQVGVGVGHRRPHPMRLPPNLRQGPATWIQGGPHFQHVVKTAS